jgi:hypothetical protein
MRVTCERGQRAVAKIPATIFSAIVILALMGSSPGQNAQVSLSDLVGIPLLSRRPSYDRLQIGATLSKSIKKRLTELDNWPSDYDALPQQKAIAVRYEEMSINPFVAYLYRQDYIQPHISYWGGAWDYASLDEAIGSAKKQCGENCVIVQENDKIVGIDRFVDDYIKERDEYVEGQKDEISKATLLLLIDRTSTPKPQTTSGRHLRAVPFSPDQQIYLGYPDRARDSLSACGDLVFYALLPVTEWQAAHYPAKLAAMQRAGIYGFYQRTAQEAHDFIIRSPGRMMDSMARFAKSITFDVDPVANKRVVLPKNLADALSGQWIKQLWFEGSVRLSPDQTPLVADMEVSPLAIRTDRNFYVGVEVHMPDDHSSCF